MTQREGYQGQRIGVVPDFSNEHTHSMQQAEESNVAQGVKKTVRQERRVGKGAGAAIVSLLAVAGLLGGRAAGEVLQHFDKPTNAVVSHATTLNETASQFTADHKPTSPTRTFWANLDSRGVQERGLPEYLADIFDGIPAILSPTDPSAKESVAAKLGLPEGSGRFISFQLFGVEYTSIYPDVAERIQAVVIQENSTIRVQDGMVVYVVNPQDPTRGAIVAVETGEKGGKGVLQVGKGSKVFLYDANADWQVVEERQDPTAAQYIGTNYITPANLADGKVSVDFTTGKIDYSGLYKG